MSFRVIEKRRVSTVILMALLTPACATTGATFRSGVGDADLEHPPWVAGAAPVPAAAGGTRIGHLPIVFQRGAAQPGIFDPSVGTDTTLGLLIDDMNAFLDSLGTPTRSSVRLVAGGKVSAVSSRATMSPPDVRFGCVTQAGLPGEDCISEGDGALGRGRQPMRLSVGRPSPEWIAWNAEVTSAQGVDQTLLITLEIGNFVIRQRGLRGTKEVELGTGHTVVLPWLTSLEAPVAVLQLTGALVGRDGKALRIGSEGFYVKRTRLAISALGAEELLRDEEVVEARQARRNDLPGAPIAWQVAMRHLVGHLTGRDQQ